MSKFLNSTKVNIKLAPVNMAVSIVSGVMVARILGPSVYTEYATLMAFVSVTLICSELGCNQGVMKQLPSAAKLNARLSLYNSLQRRRWLLTMTLATIFAMLGLWGSKIIILDNQLWKLPTIISIAVYAATILHTQLATSTLNAVFANWYSLKVTRFFTLARSFIMIIVALIDSSGLVLVQAALAVSVIEALVLDRRIKNVFAGEDFQLPSAFITKAQVGGLVSLFDKLTSSIVGGPVILLVLSGIYKKEELASFAFATDLLQKLLSVAGLPFQGIVLPMIYDKLICMVELRFLVERLWCLIVPWFAIISFGITAVLPSALPILLGENYSQSATVALIWTIPLFFESAIRMVWGSTLIALNDTKWMVYFNIVYGSILLIILFSVRGINFNMLLSILSGLQMVLSLFVLQRAYCKGLAGGRSRLPVIILVCSSSLALSLIVQHSFVILPALVRLSSGFITYACCILLSLKLFPVIPYEGYCTLVTVSGRYSGLLSRFIYRQDCSTDYA